MATIVLRPACPLCGQTIRANDWADTVGVRQVSIAHELSYARRSIERRELPIGERASPHAVVVVGLDPVLDENGEPKLEKNGKPALRPIFEPAGRKEAPDGWRDQVSRALIRTASALGLHVSSGGSDGQGAALQAAMNDPTLTRGEFRALSNEYIADAEQSLNAAIAELEFRKLEVKKAAEPRRWR